MAKPLLNTGGFLLEVSLPLLSFDTGCLGDSQQPPQPMESYGGGISDSLPLSGVESDMNQTVTFSGLYTQLTDVSYQRWPTFHHALPCLTIPTLRFWGPVPHAKYSNLCPPFSTVSKDPSYLPLCPSSAGTGMHTGDDSPM